MSVLSVYPLDQTYVSVCLSIYLSSIEVFCVLKNTQNETICQLLKKAKHIITIQFSNSIPRYIPEEIESKDWNSYLHANVQCSLIAKSGNNPSAHQQMNE